MSGDLVLVTGATGLIGNAVAKKLVAKGAKVRALVRDVARAKKILPETVELSRGDITDRASIDAAMRGVVRVFHTAGMPEQWQRDDGVFDRVNRGGTVHVLEAALAAKVDRVAYTSTMDVFAAPPGGTLVETNLDLDPKPTPYERSKQAADREVEAIRAKGLDVVHLNPAAVYGPSPVHVALNDYFLKLLNRKLPLLPPGGVSVAYVDPVAEAHVVGFCAARARLRVHSARRARAALVPHVGRARRRHEGEARARLHAEARRRRRSQHDRVPARRGARPTRLSAGCSFEVLVEVSCAREARQRPAHTAGS